MSVIRPLVLLACVAAAGPAAACADQAARMRAAVEADIPRRQVAESVGRRLIGELDQAAAHCRAGRDAQGQAIIARIRSTYGYR
jgi:hypothetical protein